MTDDTMKKAKATARMAEELVKSGMKRMEALRVAKHMMDNLEDYFGLPEDDTRYSGPDMSDEDLESYWADFELDRARDDRLIGGF